MQIGRLQEKNKTLQEKNKTLQEKSKKMAKDHKGEMEKLSKIQADSDKQLVDCMQKIKALAAERDAQAKELADLKMAAQAVVDMVDPVEDGAAGEKSLMERLLGAPR